jgi:hypothetical protein
LDDRNWDILIDAIHENQCVLVLGPEVARLPGEDGATLTDRLAEELCAGAEGLVPGQADLTEAAQMRLYDDEDILYYDVGKFFERHDETTTEVHRALASLPFTLCVQTSPDRFLYQAYRARNVEAVEAYYHFSKGGGEVRIIGDDPKLLYQCGPDRPLIFYLHGHPAEPRSLVLSWNDTLDFLVKLFEYTAQLPPVLQGPMGNSATRFLFFGFGFHRWYSQMLLHVLRRDAIRQRRLGRSIAVEPRSFFSQEHEAQTATFYHREHRIDFPQNTFEEFSAELSRRYAEHHPETEETLSVSVTSSAGMPYVFMCYNRDDDENAVSQLAAALKQKGLRLWWDRESVEGGDRWKLKVRHAIEHQVDYFVVLHSQNLFKRAAHSSVEVDLALELNKRYLGTGQRFIIPCNFLGAREYSPLLEEFSYLEVDGAGDAGRLVDTIMKDWALRADQQAS